LKTIKIHQPSSNSTSKHLASHFVERIKQQEDEFAKTLADDEEYSLIVVLYDGSIISVDKISADNPDMIVVEGVNEGNQELKLLIHMNSIQLILVKYKKIQEGKTDSSADNKIGYLSHIKTKL
jgi:hypothetical protein